MTRRSRKTRAAPKRAAADGGGKEPTECVAVRLAGPQLARIEALRPRYSRPWREATRADLLRAAILRGLDAIEAEDAPPKSSRRPRASR